MKHYDLIIIGFGKAGKTLAVTAKKKGQSVVLIEKSPEMFGGTCINVGCIPTKTLKHRASIGKGFSEAVLEKNAFIQKLRTKNQAMLWNNGVEILVGEASFIDEKRIKVNDEIISFDKVVINTGSLPVEAKFKGNDLQNVYNSTTIMERQTPINHLVVIGGGYVGLEMASIYADFGIQVSVLEYANILSREDADIRENIIAELSKNINIIEQANVQEYDGEKLIYQRENEIISLETDAVLVAISRKPNTQNLGLEKANIKTDEKGYIEVNEYLQTSVPHIFAVGDVKKDFAFTYISLDDYRILVDFIFGDKNRTTKNRGAIPYSLFINPVYSHIGINEKTAKEQNIPIRVAKFSMANSPKANLSQKPQGMMKAIINAENNQILGASLFCYQSEEIINLIKMAIDLKLEYTYFQNMIFTHPTISENFNDLFSEANIQ